MAARVAAALNVITVARDDLREMALLAFNQQTDREVTYSPSGLQFYPVCDSVFIFSVM